MLIVITQPSCIYDMRLAVSISSRAGVFFFGMFHSEASNQTLITFFACFDDQLVCATWSQNVNQGENVAQIEV